MHSIRTNFTKIPEVIQDIIGDEISEKGNYLRYRLVCWNFEQRLTGLQELSGIEKLFLSAGI